MRKTNIIILTILVIFITGCSSMEMASSWRDREIKIDGIQDDWQNQLIYIEKKNISFGLSNDENYLYACLVTPDRRTQSQMMRMGFTIWFDSKGGKDKKSGIRFPVGLDRMDFSMMRQNRDPQSDDMRDFSQAQLNEVEILGPDEDDRYRIPVSDLRGLEIKLKRNRGLLVYEIKVPLTQNEENTFTAVAGTDGKIGIGLEATKFDMEAMRDQMGEGMSGGGRGGMGGGRGGMGGGRGGMGGGRGGMGGGRGGGMGGGPQMPEQLKVWVKVQLADQ